MTEDPMRQHLSAQQAAAQRRRALERRRQASQSRSNLSGASREGVSRRVPRSDLSQAEQSPPRRSQRAGGTGGASVPSTTRAQRAPTTFDPASVRTAPRSPQPRRATGPSATRSFRPAASPGVSRSEPRHEPRSEPRSGQIPRDRQASGRRAARPASNSSRRRVSLPTKILSVGVVMAAAVAALMMYAGSKIPRTEAFSVYADRPANTPGTQTLLVGTDSRLGLSEADQQRLSTGGDVGGRRTDTIMLLHQPPSGDDVLVSLPRDLYVAVPGQGQNKLNSAFAFGGEQLLTRTIETNTGVRIDNYIEVGLGGFATIIDALGGVEYCLDAPLDDPLAGVNLPAGCQELDGPQALGVARSRAYPTGDLERIRHQQGVLSATLTKATSFSTLLNPFTAVSLLNSGLGALVMDDGDSVMNLLSFARAASSDIRRETVPVGDFASTNVGSVVKWSPLTTRYFDAIAQGNTPPTPAE